MKPAKILIGLFAMAAAAFGPGPAVARSHTGQEPVMRVTTASVIYTRRPGTVLICARGRVRSGGWTRVMLTPRIYVAPPANGIWEFDFTARPPRGMSTQVITPVAARRTWAAPRRFRGVRIVARDNSLVVRAPSRRSLC